MGRGYAFAQKKRYQSFENATPNSKIIIQLPNNSNLGLYWRLRSNQWVENKIEILTDRQHGHNRPKASQLIGNGGPHLPGARDREPQFERHREQEKVLKRRTLRNSADRYSPTQEPTSERGEGHTCGRRGSGGSERDRTPAGRGHWRGPGAG